MKKVMSVLIGAVLIISMITAPVYADEPKENSFRYKDGVPVGTDTAEETDMSLAAAENALKGIDVSTFQGDINWERVKADGIDFAIIRCGFGDDLAKYDDAKWKRNADECTRLGIPFGAYLYSYAASVEEAQSEAAHAIRLLEGYSLSYPVYLDLEDNTVGACSNAMIGQIADIFCSALREKGYEVGIYANLNWWNTKLTSDVFNNPSWHKWIAQWGSSCTYSGSYTMWQYTDKGSVAGISGNVDMDYWYNTVVSGDVNGDGIADAGDAGLILRYDAGLINLTPEQIKTGDINGDGVTDAGDAGLILRKDAGLIK